MLFMGSFGIGAEKYTSVAPGYSSHLFIAEFVRGCTALFY
jgi:hypothetical protein